MKIKTESYYLERAKAVQDEMDNLYPSAENLAEHCTLCAMKDFYLDKAASAPGKVTP